MSTQNGWMFASNFYHRDRKPKYLSKFSTNHGGDGKRNQTQTLKEYFFCHIYCAYLCSRVFAIVIASCAVSNRESWYPRREEENMFQSQRHISSRSILFCTGGANM